MVSPSTTRSTVTVCVFWASAGVAKKSNPAMISRPNRSTDSSAFVRLSA